MGQIIGKTSGYDRLKKQLYITLSESLRTGDGIKVIAGKEEPGAQVNGLFINREKVQKANALFKVAGAAETFVPEEGVRFAEPGFGCRQGGGAVFPVQPTEGDVGWRAEASCRIRCKSVVQRFGGTQDFK